MKNLILRKRKKEDLVFCKSQDDTCIQVNVFSHNNEWQRRRE
jgi:hypothetical protein